MVGAGREGWEENYRRAGDLLGRGTNRPLEEMILELSLQAWGEQVSHS